MDTIPDLRRRKLTIQGKRLLREWEEVERLCLNNKRISYVIRRRNSERLPVVYEIIYKIRSIVGVTEAREVEVKFGNDRVLKMLREPVYGNEHKMRISLPNNFPSARGNPQLFFITDIWHPNIRSSGKFKGRVCSNEKDLGVITSLASRILRIGQYLQYQLYHAIDIYPYPEDSMVAEWIREEAEPMSWVNISEGIFTDYSCLVEREKKTRMKKISISSSKDQRIKNLKL